MHPHQERVVTEKAELDEKIGKLVPFLKTSICGRLPAAEQERLGRQLGLMQQYSDLLNERITAFDHDNG
jgi:hypothetical protein